jgi:DNA-binding transcriptional LysR family regulator
MPKKSSPKIAPPTPPARPAATPKPAPSAAPPLDWDDLRHVLAVAEGGNLSLAAELLGVNHTTVLRRIAALETRLGGELFLRRARYVPTSLGDAAIAAARAMSHEAERLDQQLALGLQPLVGVIACAIHHDFLLDLAMPYVAEFLDSHPRVQLELIEPADSRAVRQADVLLGLGEAPRRHVVRRICEVSWRAYANAKLAAKLKTAGDAAQGATPWVDLAEAADLAQPHAWLYKQINASGERRVAVESLAAAAHAARAGLGVAALPSCLVAALPGAMSPSAALPAGDLQAVSEPIAPLASALWLSVAPRAQHLPRVSSFVEFMASRLAADSRLTGPALA